MDTVLLRAVLSMDAYNRGYNAGVIGFDATAIGDVAFFDDMGGADAQAIGFYAAAYQLADGSKIISYRGTDDMSVLNPFGPSDFWNGYSLQLGGTPHQNQARSPE